MDLYLDIRCVKYRTVCMLMGLLSSYTLQPAPEGEICASECCGEPTGLGVDRCRKHLRQLLDDDAKAKTEVEWEALGSTFSAAFGQQWSSPPTYDQVVRRRMEEIRAGKRPRSNVVVLDTEFSASSAQLFKVSIVNRVFGDVLINTTISHPNGPNHQKSTDPDNVRPGFVEWISRQTARRVYSKSHASKLDHLDVHQVATKLRKAGITPNTVFLVWHLSYTDLHILRKFLAAGGYDDILPTNDECFPMVNPFRQNFLQVPPGLRSFPIKLEILFPVLYPRHPLVGRNHQALVGCQQLRLVLEAYDHFCRPVKERGAVWEPAKFAAMSEATVMGDHTALRVVADRRTDAKMCPYATKNYLASASVNVLV